MDDVDTCANTPTEEAVDAKWMFRGKKTVINDSVTDDMIPVLTPQAEKQQFCQRLFR